VPEAVQRRLDEHPERMRRRRETVEHPFGTEKTRMGATHFLMKTLPRVASEVALHVLAYNMTRVMSIMGGRPLIAAMKGIASHTLACLKARQDRYAQRLTRPRPEVDIAI
jgi:hypothetical protein